MCWPVGRSTTGCMPTPSSGRGPISRCGCGSPSMLVEFLALLGARATSAQLWDVWDAATGRPVSVPLEHAGPIHAAAFRADGKVVVTGGDDESGQRGEVRLWEA